MFFKGQCGIARNGKSTKQYLKRKNDVSNEKGKVKWSKPMALLSKLSQWPKNLKGECKLSKNNTKFETEK